MHLVSIFSCSAANFSQNGAINALDIGIDRLEVNRFPVTTNLNIIMRFEYSPAEIGSHEAIVKFINGNGSVQTEQRVTLFLEEGRRHHQVFAAFNELRLEKRDSYRFDVLVDNDYKGCWPLEVEQAAPAPKRAD